MTTATTEIPRFPRGALIAAAALVFLSLGLALFARITDIGTTRTHAPPSIESRDLRFFDGPDGSIEVKDAQSGRTVHVIVSGELGFVRVLMRSLARDRRLKGIGSEPPFRLIRAASGNLSIEDPTTGQVVHLIAFGAENAAAFAPLMAQGR